MIAMKTLIFLFFFLSLRAEAQTSNDPNSVGVVASIVGRGSLKRANLPDANILPNMPVLSADLIRTDPNSSVKILLNDQSILDIGPGSAFKVDAYETSSNKPSVFSLFYGKVRALVTKSSDGTDKMKFRTTTAVMGVRGTELIINSPRSGGGSGQTLVTVVTGQVSMSLPQAAGFTPNAQNTVMLNPGQQASAAVGAQSIAPPIVLTPSQLQSQVQQGRMADNTFDRTVTIDNNPQAGQSPKAATALNMANDQITQESSNFKSLDKPGGEQSDVNLSALQIPMDVPAQIITGLLKPVKVTLLKP